MKQLLAVFLFLTFFPTSRLSEHFPQRRTPSSLQSIFLNCQHIIRTLAFKKTRPLNLDQLQFDIGKLEPADFQGKKIGFEEIASFSLAQLPPDQQKKIFTLLKSFNSIDLIEDENAIRPHFTKPALISKISDRQKDIIKLEIHFPRKTINTKTDFLRKVDNFIDVISSINYERMNTFDLYNGKLKEKYQERLQPIIDKLYWQFYSFNEQEMNQAKSFLGLTIPSILRNYASLLYASQQSGGLKTIFLNPTWRKVLEAELPATFYHKVSRQIGIREGLNFAFLHINSTQSLVFKILAGVIFVGTPVLIYSELFFDQGYEMDISEYSPEQQQMIHNFLPIMKQSDTEVIQQIIKDYKKIPSELAPFQEIIQEVTSKETM